eukprot:s1290_g10.t1
MQISVLTLTGKMLSFDVEPTTKIGPVPSIPLFTLCQGGGITAAKIQGEATSVLAKAAAEEMCRFWTSPDGLAVRQYLETQSIIRGGEHNCFKACDNVVDVDLDNSLDELLIEASRFFVLKAVNCDIAAPKLATGESPAKRAKTAVSEAKASCDGGAKLSPSWEVDQVWHALLLFPQIYYHLCMRLTADIICHDPRSFDKNQAGRYLFTFKKYAKLFGKGPPSQFWPLPMGWESDSDLRNNGVSLKGMIQDEQGIPPDHLMLLFAGKQLADDRCLQDCGLRDGSVIHMELKRRC